MCMSVKCVSSTDHKILLHLTLKIVNVQVLIKSVFWNTLCLVTVTSTPYLSPCLLVWLGWWAKSVAEAGNVSFECSDWQAWGRGRQQSPRQHIPFSLVTWLDGWCKQGYAKLSITLPCDFNMLAWHHQGLFISSIQSWPSFISTNGPQWSLLTGDRSVVRYKDTVV